MTKANANQFEFPCDIMERSGDGMSAVKIGEHAYYNLDGKVPASEWVRGLLPKTKKTFGTTDGINVMDSTETDLCGATCEGSLGYLTIKGNGVSENAQGVNLTSLPYKNGHGFNLLPENINRAMALFAARRVIVDNVWNHQDSYMTPETGHKNYTVFNHDAYIFALIDAKSNQASIKGTHNGVDYCFVNQFYPFTKAETYEMLAIERKQNFKDEVRWCKANGKFDSPSPEATRVLEAFKNCIRKSAQARPAYCKAHPELQANHWDAGYKQLKGLFAEACPDEFAELKAAVKALKDKMLPLVYEVGFLRK